MPRMGENLTMSLKPVHERYNNADNRQSARAEHVRIAPHIIAVESVIFCQHYACADEHRNADIIQTRHPLKEMIVVDA